MWCARHLLKRGEQFRGRRNELSRAQIEPPTSRSYGCGALTAPGPDFVLDDEPRAVGTHRNNGVSQRHPHIGSEVEVGRVCQVAIDIHGAPAGEELLRVTITEAFAHWEPLIMCPDEGVQCGVNRRLCRPPYRACRTRS